MTENPVRLICVDDEPSALDQIRLVFSEISAPIVCEYFGSPKAALDAHKEEPAALVLSDLRMGTTTGLHLISDMQIVAPDSIYMLLSGDADLKSALIAMNQSRVFRFLTKPVEPNELALSIAEARSEYNLRQMRKLATVTLDALEKTNTALATVSVRGELLFANEPAHQLIAHSGYFSINSDQVLCGSSPAETKNFLNFLKSFAGLVPSTERSIFRFSRFDMYEPMIVSAVRADSGDADNDVTISLMILDPTRQDITSPEAIATALNIAPSEARVVHGLVAGGSVDEAASLAGVSVSTARTYLKNVYNKTGVSRQAELVRLVMLTAA